MTGIELEMLPSGEVRLTIAGQTEICSSMEAALAAINEYEEEHT